ncbi:uncharacterized protein [Miscanthus floridulus]|uniref:uncharacterized protein n=1 Tax=Miscanthus floridulus TaxID=154761 RepID=UPI003459A3D4
MGAAWGLGLGREGRRGGATGGPAGAVDLPLLDEDRERMQGRDLDRHWVWWGVGARGVGQVRSGGRAAAGARQCGKRAARQWAAAGARSAAAGARGGGGGAGRPGLPGSGAAGRAVAARGGGASGGGGGVGRPGIRARRWGTRGGRARASQHAQQWARGGGDSRTHRAASAYLPDAALAFGAAGGNACVRASGHQLKIN